MKELAWVMLCHRVVSCMNRVGYRRVWTVGARVGLLNGQRVHVTCSGALYSETSQLASRISKQSRPFVVADVKPLLNIRLLLRSEKLHFSALKFSSFVQSLLFAVI